MTDTLEVLVVYSTFSDPQDAQRVARQLVEERLVACAQILSTPIHSMYHWDGEVRSDDETLLLMKSTEARWPELQDRLMDLHPYDVPEIVATPARASQSYGAWLYRMCEPEPDATGGSPA